MQTWPLRSRAKGSRRRRLLLTVLGLAVGLVAASWVSTILRPHSPGWRLRSAEWARDHYLGSVVDLGEWCWFTLRKGRLDQLEAVGLSEFPPAAPYGAQPESPDRGSEPAPIRPLVATALAGEGTWRSVGRLVRGRTTLRCTTFRPDIDHPRVIVGVARFDPELTRYVLVPGTQDPGGVWSWGGEVPTRERGSLLAAFNSGFRLNEAQGGYYVEGKVARRLVAKAASLVLNQQGKPDIVAWGSAAVPGPEVAAVRQNLRLIAEKGAVEPDLLQNRDGAWGFGRNEGYYSWRSGIGITGDGSLVYVAGDGLTLSTLAGALVHAGSVRAMELDIHDKWSTFNVYQSSSRRPLDVVATKLLPDMPWSGERYLTPDDRDFVAVFVR